MDVPANKEDAVLQRSARVALMLSLSIVGIAVVYFGALYLVAH
jgi:hypothetical protein